MQVWVPCQQRELVHTAGVGALPAELARTADTPKWVGGWVGGSQKQSGTWLFFSVTRANHHGNEGCQAAAALQQGLLPCLPHRPLPSVANSTAEPLGKPANSPEDEIVLSTPNL